VHVLHWGGKNTSLGRKARYQRGSQLLLTSILPKRVLERGPKNGRTTLLRSSNAHVSEKKICLVPHAVGLSQGLAR